MLITASDLKGYRLGARDGEIGRVKDFYFDDQNWVVRYLVADTGRWLPRQLVLLSPHALGPIERHEKVVDVNLNKEQIESSPSIDEHQPVSREYETRYYRHYGWPMYWEGSMLWGAAPYPAVYPGLYAPPPGSPEAELMARRDFVQQENHLRSMNAVSGYHFEARDGAMGHLDDFILDDRNWVIRYLILDTRNWWPGKHVLVTPQWITSIDWHTAKVSVDLDRETIRHAPEYARGTELSRQYEEALHDYYEREGYWKHQAEPAAVH